MQKAGFLITRVTCVTKRLLNTLLVFFCYYIWKVNQFQQGYVQRWRVLVVISFVLFEHELCCFVVTI